jgi:hypothetical protein
MTLADDIERDERAYPNRRSGSDSCHLAGPATNYLFAIVLAFGLVAIGGVEAEARRLRYVVKQVTSGEVRRRGQAVSGDEILTLDGAPLWLRGGKGRASSSIDSGGKVMTLTVLRSGKEVTVAITPKNTWPRRPTPAPGLPAGISTTREKYVTSACWARSLRSSTGYQTR